MGLSKKSKQFSRYEKISQTTQFSVLREIAEVDFDFVSSGTQYEVATLPSDCFLTNAYCNFVIYNLSVGAFLGLNGFSILVQRADNTIFQTGGFCTSATGSEPKTFANIAVPVNDFLCKQGDKVLIEVKGNSTHIHFTLLGGMTFKTVS